MRQITQTELDSLESLIDSLGIEAVVHAVADICGTKAVHIAENWQDASLAKRWAVLANAIEQTATKAGGL